MNKSKSLKEKLSILPLPKLFVFDLDYTIWPFWCDTHTSPPFSKDKNGCVVDCYGYKVKLYKDVIDILKSLNEQEIAVAAASRTDDPETAKKLLNILNINKYFKFKQIYPGCKVMHFKKLKEESNLEFNEMVFFDDEYRNIRDITEIGVVCQHVKNGVSEKEIFDCVDKFQENIKSKYS